MEDHCFDDENIGICVQDKSGKVLRQNKLCEKICGSQFGKVCENNCQLLQANSKEKRSCRYYSNQLFSNTPLDVMIYEKKNINITIMAPLIQQYQEDKQRLEHSSLTKREKEIAFLISKGLKNSEICQKLFISMPTLKTHLNHIYKKIGKSFLRSRRLETH